jgi:NAD(P)-dependent dehydrogenase (short-subunit alcohol dehydrogenase family)
VAEIATELGRVDVLFNCAGIVRRSLLVDTDEEDLHRMIGINLMGTVRVTRAVLPHLKQSRGCVINFSSTLTVRPVPGLTLYAASKGGIEAFTRALSIEAAEDGVRVNAILPALVRSDIWRSAGMSEEAYDTLMRERGREYPLGRVGEPEDVADLAMYLASSRASWLTGACIPLDGGSGVNSVVR